MKSKYDQMKDDLLVELDGDLMECSFFELDKVDELKAIFLDCAEQWMMQHDIDELECIYTDRFGVCDYDDVIGGHTVNSL